MYFSPVNQGRPQESRPFRALRRTLENVPKPTVLLCRLSFSKPGLHFR